MDKRYRKMGKKAKGTIREIRDGEWQTFKHVKGYKEIPKLIAAL